jgi:sulfide:quinone oxidoreductase
MTPDDTLARLDERLSRIEARLDRLTEVLDRAPAALAMAADTFDEWAARQQRRGVDLDARAVAGERLLLALSEPEVARRLERLVELLPRLLPVAELAGTFEPTTAMVFDMFDAHVARLTERGVDVEARFAQLARLLERLTDPSFDTHLHELLDAAPSLMAATRTGELFGRAVDHVTGAGAEPVGALGLLRALGRPEVQRTVGFALAVAARVGAELPATTTPHDPLRSPPCPPTSPCSSSVGAPPASPTAALLRQLPNAPAVGVVEPSEQPLLPAALDARRRRRVPQANRACGPTADYIPRRRDLDQGPRPATFRPGAQPRSRTASGAVLTLPRSSSSRPGIQLDWHKIEGLAGNARQGWHHLATTLYESTVPYTWALLQAFQGGTAVFTFPNDARSSAPGPRRRSCTWPNDHFCRREGCRDKTKDRCWMSAGAAIFGVKKYAKTRSPRSWSQERDVDTRFRRDLVAVRPEVQARPCSVTSTTGTEADREVRSAPRGPRRRARPTSSRRVPLANAPSWIDGAQAHPAARHLPGRMGPGRRRAASPTSQDRRRPSASRRRSLVENLAGASPRVSPLEAQSYDGYASLPARDGLRQAGARRVRLRRQPRGELPIRPVRGALDSMWATKAYALPRMYWHGMLRGRW